MQLLACVLILLASLCLQSARADAVLVLRSWGDLTSTTRTLSLTITIADDRKTIHVMAVAFDSVSKTKLITIVHGPNLDRILLMCNDEVCRYDWPVSTMDAGNNDIAMITTNVAGQRFMTTAKIGRP